MAGLAKAGQAISAGAGAVKGIVRRIRGGAAQQAGKQAADEATQQVGKETAQQAAEGAAGETARQATKATATPQSTGVNPRSLNIEGSTQPELFEGTIQGMRQQLRNPQTAEAFWRDSVAKDGPIRILEVNGKRYIENGNHRFQAALAQGVKIPEWAIKVEQAPN
jgi:hypothetical protein